MSPVLFTIGPYNVYAFGFFLVLSFISSTFIIWKLTKDELKEEEYLDAYLYTTIVTIFSARIGYIILHPEQFGLNILKYILVRQTPGLSFIIGILGGLIFLLGYIKKKKLPKLRMLDIFSIALSFGLGLVKIGEQLGGAGFGKETNFFISVRIAGVLGEHHPVELYEALLFFLLSFLLWILYKKVRERKFPEGMVFNVFAVVLFVSIFLLEFLKLYPVYLLGLSQKQIASLVLIVPSAYQLYNNIVVLRRKK